MSPVFDQAFDATVGHEGGYVNDPRDPGGETNWGVSKRSYPGLDIRALTKDQAKSIYWTDYWLPAGCADMPPETAAAVFDLAVNAGRAAALRDLQTALGLVPDGVLGPKTQAAIKAIPAGQDAAVATDVHALGLARRTDAPGWPAFGKGWARRVAANLRALAARSKG